ncbi:MAG: PmeII family type II restriction endonuclease [Prevotellaceae bacterium]|nr:PmeII family type II restriction endonuclease [Prevotellaceae bacterium]
MTDQQKQAIIDSGKDYFRTTIIPNHIKNLEKLSLDDFDVNPFLINYLAAFLCGNTKPESLAKALVYPRILGSSVNTTFGMSIQIFISKLSQITGGASGIDGIDIEFVDALDGRKKYCQCTAGPKTINKDDVATILGHFKKLIGKARLDRMPLQMDDMIVGVLFGENLFDDYKIINSAYPVYCASEFWERLTGDKNFYNTLIRAFFEVMDESKVCKELLSKIEHQIIYSKEATRKCYA